MEPHKNMHSLAQLTEKGLAIRIAALSLESKLRIMGVGSPIEEVTHELSNLRILCNELNRDLKALTK